MIQLVNRTGIFMRQLTANQEEVLNKMGEFCKGKMDEYVAVKTGNLKSRNQYVINKNELFLQNDCEYALFQEMGTYKMKAHPFMKPAVFNHLSEIKDIAATGFGRGMR